MRNRLLALGALLLGAALIAVGIKAGLIDRGIRTNTAVDSSETSVIRGLVFVVAGRMIGYAGLARMRQK